MKQLFINTIFQSGERAVGMPSTSSPADSGAQALYKICAAENALRQSITIRTLITPRKNQMLLLGALTEARDCGPSYEKMIAGDGLDRRELDALTILPGLSAQMIFASALGKISETPAEVVEGRLRGIGAPHADAQVLIAVLENEQACAHSRREEAFLTRETWREFPFPARETNPSANAFSVNDGAPLSETHHP